MTYKRYKSKYGNDSLSSKKIKSIIIDLKENCDECKKEITHICCIKDIILDWKNIKQWQ